MTSEHMIKKAGSESIPSTDWISEASSTLLCPAGGQMAQHSG